MATDRDQKTARSQMTVEDLKGSLMQRVGLVALPVLAFQRNMLGIVRTGIKDDGLLKPLQTLAQNELQALLMILDPLGKWRDSLGADMEKKLKDTFDRAGPKVISGAVSLIDAQQELLDVLIEALDKARKSQVPKKK